MLKKMDFKEWLIFTLIGIITMPISMIITSILVLLLSVLFSFNIFDFIDIDKYRYFASGVSLVIWFHLQDLVLLHHIKSKSCYTNNRECWNKKDCIYWNCRRYSEIGGRVKTKGKLGRIRRPFGLYCPSCNLATNIIYDGYGDPIVTTCEHCDSELPLDRLKFIQKGIKKDLEIYGKTS